MDIKDIFRFKNGRTVIVGIVENGPPYIAPGEVEVRACDEPIARFRIEGEMLSGMGEFTATSGLRAVSTASTQAFDREFLSRAELILTPVFPDALHDSKNGDWRTKKVYRHLIGVDDPPSRYVADPVTQGPMLPEGWDGDAWLDPQGKRYFLRAWSKRDNRVAYGEATTYEEARRALLHEVAEGNRRPEIPAVAG
jgi:hypothetical protein